MNERELDLALDNLGELHVRRVAPVALRQRVSAVPMEIDERREWRGRLRWSPRFFSATAVAAVAAVVLLGGGLLVSGLLTEPDGDPLPAAVVTPSASAAATVEPDAIDGPTATPAQTQVPPRATSPERPVELPANIPSDIESGRWKTPLGVARWVRLSSDAADSPRRLRSVDSTSDGYVMVDQTGDAPGLWRSQDFLHWTREPVDPPAERGHLVAAPSGAIWWRDGGDLWRLDGQRWERIDLNTSPPPQRDGFEYALYVNDPVVGNGAALVPYVWSRKQSLVLEGHEFSDQILNGNSYEAVEPGVYRLGHREDEVPLVRFEEVDGGVRMVRDDDGTELKVIDGVSLEYIELMAYGRDFPSQHGLQVVRGDQVVDVRLPEELRTAAGLTYTTDGPGFTAYAQSGPGGHIYVYRSPDGLEWRDVATIGDDAGEPADADFVERPGVYSYQTSTQAGQGLWTTSDGIQWHERPHATAHRLGPGWIRGGNSFRWWYYPDGGDVVRIDHSPVGIPPKSECSGNPMPISANTLEFSCVRDGIRDTWLITFDELSTAGSEG